MDAHLMVKEPIRYIEDFKKAGADLVTIHYEACEDVAATIAKIRECDMKVGLSINPETDVNVVEKYLKDVDMLLVMSVHPGFGGQKFIEETFDRIRTLKSEIDRQGLPVKIEIDGGVCPANAKQLIDAGAEILVAGSAVFKSEDPAEVIASLRG
jgi:ribulose-phosphate 3-epimerase